MEGGQQPGTYTYVGSGALKVCVFPQIRQPVVLGHEANAALCPSNCGFPSFSCALSPGVVRGRVGWGCLFCVSAVSLRRAPGVVEASGTECGVRVCALLVLRGLLEKFCLWLTPYGCVHVVCFPTPILEVG